MKAEFNSMLRTKKYNPLTLLRNFPSLYLVLKDSSAENNGTNDVPHYFEPILQRMGFLCNLHLTDASECCTLPSPSAKDDVELVESTDPIGRKWAPIDEKEGIV